MIVIPALNLRDGASVRPENGTRDVDAAHAADAIALARSWAGLGFSRIHITDLDAASGRGDNARLIASLLSNIEAPVQVGGDVRTLEEIDRLLQAGADRVVIGVQAIEDGRWLADAAAQFPGRVAPGVLVRDRHVVTRDRTVMARDFLSVIEDWNELPLAAVIVTVAQRHRHVRGSDLFLMEDLTDVSLNPVIAAGGITTLSELRDLEERGVSATIVGWALSARRLDARVLAEEFPQA